MHVIALLGMSGVGKSHWAKKLAARGWLRLDCDTEIAARLSAIVPTVPEQEPVQALGEWMGMPWHQAYGDREAAYLALEEEVTRAALTRAIEAAASGEKVVIDCTGSVIHLSARLLSDLVTHTRLVYLHTPEERHGAMLARYLAEPKPVVWAGHFQPEGAERAEAALPRLYPALLVARAARYGALAHHRVDAGWLETTTDDEGLAAILAGTEPRA